MTKINTLTRRRFLQASTVAAGVIHTGAAVFPALASSPAADTGEGVTRLLARFTVESRPESIPGPVRKEALRSLLNWVGCALGGSRHATLNSALAALSEFSGPRLATVLGRAERLDILHAALMNGMSSHVLDFDDTHLATIIHPSGPVAPAILALAERQKVTGRDFLHAFILGIEVECRIGRAVYPSHYDVGWHITGTAGVFGAAAAAGKLLGLNEQQMTWAFGIAATQSSGFREMFGSMCKSFHPGRAAQNGLGAALLAAKNFTSSEQSIEAPRGFAHVTATERDFSAIRKDLGQRWEISENTYKPFPCGIVIHPVIDGCLQLREEHRPQSAQIERVELRVHPLVLELTGKKTPTTGLEGKFSVYHSAAVSLIQGTPTVRAYSDEVVRNPEIISLRDRVSATVDEGLRKEEAHVTVVMRDGRRLHRHVEHAVGSLERPMSDADLEAKFRGLAQGVLPAKQTDELIALCWAAETLDHAAAIARAAIP